MYVNGSSSFHQLTFRSASMARAACLTSSSVYGPAMPASGTVTLVSTCMIIANLNQPSDLQFAPLFLHSISQITNWPLPSCLRSPPSSKLTATPQRVCNITRKRSTSGGNSCLKVMTPYTMPPINFGSLFILPDIIRRMLVKKESGKCVHNNNHPIRVP
jgi:hypothetical protein